jgi:hypothetical protein
MTKNNDQCYFSKRIDDYVGWHIRSENIRKASDLGFNGISGFMSFGRIFHNLDTSIRTYFDMEFMLPLYFDGVL